MFLEQINRRLAKVQNMTPTRKPPTPRTDGAKVVGVPVPPDMYIKLVALKEKRGLGSIKEALLHAATTGFELMEAGWSTPGTE